MLQPKITIANPIAISRETITQTAPENFLRIKLDGHLEFSGHIDQTINKGSAAVDYETVLREISGAGKFP